MSVCIAISGENCWVGGRCNRSDRYDWAREGVSEVERPNDPVPVLGEEEGFGCLPGVRADEDVGIAPDSGADEGGREEDDASEARAAEAYCRAGDMISDLQVMRVSTDLH